MQEPTNESSHDTVMAVAEWSLLESIAQMPLPSSL